MQYAVVAVPAAPVRRKPRHQLEMVNQLLFGEMVEIIKAKKDKWIKVKSLHDGYAGWVTRNMLQETEENSAATNTDFVTADKLNEVVINGNKMNVPLGSSLPAFINGSGGIENFNYEFLGHHIHRNQKEGSAEQLLQWAITWLNAPYLWGGRTLLGVDCSGFVQVNFKMIGIDLPRDAWQQAQEGKPLKKLKDAAAGDLAFFDDKEEIVHVGILLDTERIIHASGKVRIDTIDKKGIVNSDTGKRTHQLKAIRRVF